MLKIIQFFAKFGNVIEMAAVIRKKRDPGENIFRFGTVLYIKKTGNFARNEPGNNWEFQNGKSLVTLLGAC